MWDMVGVVVVGSVFAVGVFAVDVFLFERVKADGESFQAPGPRLYILFRRCGWTAQTTTPASYLGFAQRYDKRSLERARAYKLCGHKQLSGLGLEA